MMERIREGTNGLVVKIILSLIIFSFAFAGVGSYLVSGSDTPAATVGDREISRSQFEQVYQNERARLQSQAGEFFTALMGDPQYLEQFRQNVLDQMVNDVLLEVQADQLGLRISDQQIKTAIRTMPQFQRDGSFSNELYNAGLRRAGFSPDQFAEYMRQELVREQLVASLQNSEFVLGGELQAQFTLEGQTRSVRSLTLPVAKFAADADVTDEQMQEYYEQNSFQFVRPAQAKVAYVELSGETIADVAEVSDEEAKAYYEANISKYGTAEQRKVSHILVQGEGDDNLAKAEDLLAKINAGAEFATVAKESSDDTFSAKEGGALDWFETGVMDPAFEEASFALANKGDVSGVVKSDFGFHIIKLDDIKVSQVESFENVEGEIVAQLKQQHAAEKFYELSNILADKAFEMPDNLEEAANAVQATVKTTGFISAQDAEGVLANPAVTRALLSEEVLEDRLNSDIIEIAPEHVIVVRVEDARPETVLPFDDVSEKVKQALSQQQGEKKALDLAQTLLAELREGKTETLATSGYQFGDAKEIGRVSEQREIAELAFTLAKPSEGETSYGMTRSAGDVVVVALDKVTDPVLPEISSDSQMATRVSRTLANTGLSATLGQLKTNTEVSYPVSEDQE